MKVYRVHADGPSALLNDSALVDGSVKSVKLKGISPATDRETLRAVLSHLAGRLHEPHVQEGAILATAGHRLRVAEADVAWGGIRGWADANPGVFIKCGNGTDNSDCETVPGSVEARYEMESMQRSVLQSGKESPHGFASCGGASIQIGFQGSQEDLNRCLADLSPTDSHFYKSRVSVSNVSGVPALTVSFLSVFDYPQRPCEIQSPGWWTCDYEVGGLDQMRGRFDEFLTYSGYPTNVCLSPHTVRKTRSECAFFNGASTCVIDRYGGKISSLPPDTAILDVAERKLECHKRVQEFFKNDLMLFHWNKSKSCSSLAAGVDSLGLLTAFSRPAQLGASPVNLTFSGLLDSWHTLNFATAEETKDDKDGLVLSSMLLVQMLASLGVRSDATMHGIDAEWATEAMRGRGLAPGWLKAGSCVTAGGDAEPWWKDLRGGAGNQNHADRDAVDDRVDVNAGSLFEWPRRGFM